LAGRRTNVTLLTTFGEIAVGLCAIGVYAIASFAASGRRRELAIRAALGATSRDLAALMCRQEFIVVIVGPGIGLFLASIAADSILGPVFDTSLLDPATYAKAAGLLIGVGALATFLPAWRAAVANAVDLLRG